MARILIVDDSSVVRLKLRKLLEKFQHDVIESPNGAAGVKNFRLMKPDLVTMDINMPEMGGIDAVREIISKHPAAKIIMISSAAEEDGIVTAVKYGARGYILKPFDDARVMQVINRVLSE